MAASSPALSGTPGRMRSRKSEENAVANQPIVDQWSRGSKQDRFSGPGGMYNRPTEQAPKEPRRQEPRRRSLQKEFAAGASPVNSPRRSSGLRRASSSSSATATPPPPASTQEETCPPIPLSANEAVAPPTGAAPVPGETFGAPLAAAPAAPLAPPIDAEACQLREALQQCEEAAIECLVGGMVRTAAAAAVAEVVAREGDFMASLVVIAAAKAEHAVSMLQQALAEPGRQHETGISSATLSGSLPTSLRGTDADRSTPPPSCSLAERISDDLAHLQRSRQTPEVPSRYGFQHASSRHLAPLPAFSGAPLGVRMRPEAAGGRRGLGRGSHRSNPTSRRS